MDGKQVLQWTVSYPNMVKKPTGSDYCIHNLQQTAFGAIGRKAITYDPKWNEGNYCGNEIPVQGLALAHLVNQIAYLINASMQKKFGRVQQNEQVLYRPPIFRSNAT